MSTSRKVLLLGGLGAVLVVAAAAAAMQAGAGTAHNGHAATASMHNAQGEYLGKVWFLPRAGGKVAVRASTSLLPAGFHGFHVHSVGVCEAPFTSAGGHYNPGSVGHGTHAGDMPVLFVGSDGNAWAEFETDAFTVQELLDLNGSAVIVHAGADNYANIPTRYAAGGVPGPDATTLATGDAGARIACGVVGRQ